MQLKTAIVWLTCAMMTQAGCRHFGGGGDGDGDGRDSGEPEPPDDPGPFTGGTGGSSGGTGGSGETGGSGGSDSPMLQPNFELSCMDIAPSGANSDPFAAWADELAAHGELGYPATFRVEGATYRAHGVAHTSIEAPFVLRTSHSGSGLLTVGDAMVEGVEERGELALYGVERGVLPASSGSIEDLALKTVVVEAGLMTGALDLATERIGNTDFYRTSPALSISELAIADVQQAYLKPEGSFGIEERIEWMPSGPVVIAEALQLTFHEEDVGAVELTGSEPLALDYDAFSVAGDFASGALEAEGLEVRGTPVAIFGRSAELHASLTAIEARERFRLTQAINEAGLVLPAAVEVVSEAAEVWVAPNETRIVRFHFRERSYLGDAVLGDIQLGGEAESLLELQTGFPETLTGELVEAVIDTGWAAPIASIAALPVVPIVFVIDVFDCIFGGCADHPPPLDPFPQWIEAGAMGTMEVRVKGSRGVGSYQTSLTFVGRNYCPVTVPLTVHVGQEPDADAGS